MKKMLSITIHWDSSPLPFWNQGHPQKSTAQTCREGWGMVSDDSRAFCFLYTFLITSVPPDHQALDPRGWKHLHQGNANQKQVSSFTCQNGNYQKDSKQQDVEKGNPHALLVGMQIGAPLVENNIEIPQNVKNRNYHMIQKFHFSIFICRK